ncbi:hypothetical protein Hanom_Chr11g01060301 [Helianthus anomalus]
MTCLEPVKINPTLTSLTLYLFLLSFLVKNNFLSCFFSFLIGSQRSDLFLALA